LPDEVVKKVEPKVEAIKVEKPKAPPKSASKRTGQITLSAVKRNATARRKIEEMRELRSLEDSFMDPDYDYLPERW